MTTFLAGGTGTPKLLTGLERTDAFDASTTTVIANTGDDVEVGGLIVCPDVDTVLYLRGGLLDRDRWWGIADDTTATHEKIAEFGAAMDIPQTPRYLPADRQTGGRTIARWRRFSGAVEFMELGDTDRAIHTIRTGLLDEGKTLTEVTNRLAEGFGLTVELLPMSDDPVASIIHTAEGSMHFQEFWVANRGDPAVTDVEFRGAETAHPTAAVTDALTEPVVIGPSNPVTSIGPMIAMDAFEQALYETPVVAVSPFLGDTVFSGPAASLMEAVGLTPTTAGLPEAYPFVDAIVVDETDETDLAVPTVATDIRIDGPNDAARVLEAVASALKQAT